MVFVKEMSPAGRLEYYAQKIAQVTPPRNAFQQRMRMVYNRLMAEERGLLKRTTEK